MILHKLVPLFALALNLLLLGGALAPDRKSHRNYVFAYFISALAVWNLGVFALRSSADPATALIWERVLHVGVIAIPALFYHYVLALLDAPRRSWTLRIAYVVGGAFLAVSPTSSFMRGVSETYWGFAPVAGPFYGVFFVYFQTYMLLGLIRLVRALRSQLSNFRRNRIRLVVAGVGVSLAGGLVDFARYILGWEHLYPVGIPCNALFALAVGLAIVRYRLVDVSMLARRFAVHVVISLAVAPVLVGGPRLADQVTSNVGGDIPAVMLALGAVMAALMIMRTLETRLSRLLFARQNEARDTLLALSTDLASVLDIQKLGRTLTEGLVRGIPAAHASFHLYDPAQSVFVPLSKVTSPASDAVPDVGLDGKLSLWLPISRRALAVEELHFQAGTDSQMDRLARELETARVALLVPLFLDGQLAAMLVLGEKVSREVFTSGEITLIETLMGQTATALKNARLYEDLRQQMDELRRTQQQLVQSAKLAAIGELAASVAHEINSPLTVVLGAANMIRRHVADDSPAQLKLATIETEAMRAGKITRDLLQFARRREPNREPLALEAVTERALALLSPKLVRASVGVETSFDPAIPPILGDQDELTQVFINLIGNAADAMPDGGKVIIRTTMCAGTGTVRIEVTDTGIGMTPEQLSRIFEPFYTTKPEGRGTGLGLSVSLGIVRNHGGALEAVSEPGKGTTMVIALPLPGTAAHAAAPADPLGGCGPADAPNGEEPAAALDRLAPVQDVIRQIHRVGFTRRPPDAVADTPEHVDGRVRDLVLATDRARPPGCGQ